MLKYINSKLCVIDNVYTPKHSLIQYVIIKTFFKKKYSLIFGLNGAATSNVLYLI